MSEDRIDCNNLGIDDVAINDIELFRLERMSETSFWICCYKRGYEENYDTENEDKYKVVFQANVVDGKLIIESDNHDSVLEKTK